MRIVYLLFGVLVYFLFFGTFLYLVAFVGNAPQLPVTVDRGGTIGPMAAAVPVDLGLIALFGVQHSIMARPGFKSAWTLVVPPPIERTVFVLAASLVLILLFMLWRPIPAPVWSVADPVAAAILWALFGLGWLIVLLSTFLINHFELFGLHQVWSHARGSEMPAPRMRKPFLYRMVRHPIYSGFFLAFWAAPQMSQGHLLLAAGMSVYMLVGIRFEERDLVGQFGAEYEGYRRATGMLAPRLARRRN